MLTSRPHHHNQAPTLLAGVESKRHEALGEPVGCHRSTATPSTFAEPQLLECVHIPLLPLLEICKLCYPGAAFLNVVAK